MKKTYRHSDTPQHGTGQVPVYYYINIKIIIIHKNFCSTWPHCI